MQVLGTADVASAKALIFKMTLNEEAEKERDRLKFLRLLYYVGQFYELGQVH